MNIDEPISGEEDLEPAVHERLYGHELFGKYSEDVVIFPALRVRPYLQEFYGEDWRNQTDVLPMSWFETPEDEASVNRVPALAMVS